MQSCMSALQKLDMELQYDPAIPLRGVYPPKELKSGRYTDTCTSTFKATLSTIP
jgi:hypothetical protein